jgi:hypothetical protein
VSAALSEPLWGVGCYEDGDRRVAWEISHAEIQRDMVGASRVLGDLGIVRGGRVLFCSMLSETGQFWPLVVGAMLAGAQLSCADANEGDATRVAMFTRLVGYDAVLGVTGAVLDGLDAAERDYRDVFGRIRVLGARPDAYDRLAAAGLAPHHVVLCGPAVAIGREPGAPARVDADEWELDRDADRIVVSSRRPRATTFERTPTGVRGQIVDGGVVPAVPAGAKRA